MNASLSLMRGQDLPSLTAAVMEVANRTLSPAPEDDHGVLAVIISLVLFYVILAILFVCHKLRDRRRNRK